MISLKTIRTNKCTRLFTLVELMVSMFLFLIIMAIVARYFAAANRAWRITARKNEVYANARVALDIIARDLQGALYNNDWTVNGRGVYPFFHYDLDDYDVKGPGDEPPLDEKFRKPYDNKPIGFTYLDNHGTDNLKLFVKQSDTTWTGALEMVFTSTPTGDQLCMITQTKLRPKVATSDICEVKYSRYRDYDEYSTGSEEERRDNEFWLIRSCTTNKNSDGSDNTTTYDFISNPIVDRDGNWRSSSGVLDIFSSSSSWEKVIPNVVDLRFECYRHDLSLEPGLTSTTATASVAGSNWPQRVKIILTTMDEASMAKYKTLRDKAVSAKDKEAVSQYFKNHKLTFSRTVYMRSKESF